MSDSTIICPKCHAEIPLTESLAAPLVEATRQKFEEQLRSERARIEEREQEVKAKLSQAEALRKGFEEELSKRLAAERSRIAEEEARKAKLVLENELAQRTDQISTLQEALTDRDKKLAEARHQQAELLRQQRALEEAKASMELTIEQRVTESLAGVKERAKKEVEDAIGLRVREKEEQIASMTRQIEELKRKAEQGSQQLQGEVLELELETLLRHEFPLDVIEPVAKGQLGADVVQRVNTREISGAGSILWEIKRTKNWSDGWLAKLRGDLRAAHADVALIISQALPAGVDTFDHREGVWVAAPQCAIPVAIALRQLLISVAGARRSSEGQLTKTEMIYEYLTGPRFRHRVEAIVEQFAEMQGDLEKERRSITRSWAKREQQIRTVLESTAGMYGDLQGIAGRSIPEVAGLDLDLLEGPDDAEEGA